MIIQVIKGIIRRVGELVFVGRNKAQILIGTDRKDTLLSGYGDGGENDVDSSVIDLVAGFSPDNTDPDYINDKSRIYIAEKTDPDDYFGINKGSAVVGEASIVSKSENIYLKATRKIKIINGNVSILVDENGNISIESSNQTEIKVGSSKIIVSNSGIELDAGQGITGNIITDQDVCVGLAPPGGGQVICSFLQPPAAPTRNQKVKIK